MAAPRADWHSGCVSPVVGRPRKSKRRDPRADHRECDARIERLEKRIAELEVKLAEARKDSSNSSKPPSSDIVKPPKPKPPKNGKKRSRGGQPGHPRHERPPFEPEQVDEFHDYTLEECPDCAGELVPGQKAPRVIQQVEIIEQPIRIDEHRGHAYWCASCQKLHYAPLPAELVQAGLSGPRLTALVAYMKGVCHASFSTVRKFLRDVVGVRVSRGYLRKLIAKVSDALEDSWEELRVRLAFEPHLNVDETGHKNNGERFWTWCFRAAQYTVFKVDKSRGSKVLIEVLGTEFDGVLGCDYFSAYRKYMGDFGVLLQFCLAHLIRDVKFLTKLPDTANREFGELVLGGLRRLFRVIHRREDLGEEEFQVQLEETRDNLLAMAEEAPEAREAQNLAKRFETNGDAYFRFVTTPGVEPTNNLAEQAIRFVVIDRRITQGTRSKGGQEWCERIWTVIATCVQQGRPVMEFLEESIRAHFASTPGPSLIFDTS